MSTKKIPTSVYAEMTPNPTTMKFVADRELVTGGHQLDFVTTEEAELCSPLAVELFHFPFVTGVFISGSIVSVKKDDSLGWEMIVSQLREYIREWLMDNEFAVEEGKVEGAIKVMGDLTPMPANPDSEVSDNFIHESDIKPSEHDDEIVRLLDEFVKPAVEQDGGAIDFVAFKGGTVYVNLRGACSGCPSSTQTLKGGIEQLLSSKIEAVKDVVAVGI
jgi:Fe-S cluster biogenesis protein NfuA|tara:strand:- start:260 stop:913 length:654 start_codon:yes stop_codon:yes gene_type:complete